MTPVNAPTPLNTPTWLGLEVGVLNGVHCTTYVEKGMELVEDERIRSTVLIAILFETVRGAPMQ